MPEIISKGVPWCWEDFWVFKRDRLNLGTYGPRDRLLVLLGCSWLCPGHSHSKVLEVILIAFVVCSLAGYLLSKGAKESSSRQALVNGALGPHDPEDRVTCQVLLLAVGTALAWSFKNYFQLFRLSIS